MNSFGKKCLSNLNKYKMGKLKTTVSLLVLTCWINTILAQTDFGVFLKADGFDGSITILDYKNNKWLYSDTSDAKKATLPASTFKIINSCIALETNVIEDENEVIKWNGEIRKFQGEPVIAWNRDTYLKDAFQNSTIWFYVELAKRIGNRNYREFLSKCHYGNGKINNDTDGDFWNYGDFAVTPINQIEFLQAIYERKLPFSERTYKIVEEIMIDEKTENYTIRGKTGWTTKHGKDIGWWVGYIEVKDNVYFFATRLIKGINDDKPNFSKARKEIVRKAFKEIGVLQD